MEVLRERFEPLTPSLTPSDGERVSGRTGEGKGEHAGLQLLHDDALEFIRREPRDWSDWKLVANLPYSVASPILVELALSTKRPERMVVTLQLEVAQRLMADADDDDYGVLTLLVQLSSTSRATGSRFHRAAFSRSSMWTRRASRWFDAHNRCCRTNIAPRS